MNPEYSDKELLDTELGGITLRDMGAMTFMGWLANRLNGAQTYRAETQELLAAVSAPPMGRVIGDGEKIRLVRKLLAINIPLK